MGRRASQASVTVSRKGKHRSVRTRLGATVTTYLFRNFRLERWQQWNCSICTGLARAALRSDNLDNLARSALPPQSRPNSALLPLLVHSEIKDAQTHHSPGSDCVRDHGCACAFVSAVPAAEVRTGARAATTAGATARGAAAGSASACPAPSLQAGGGAVAEALD